MSGRGATTLIVVAYRSESWLPRCLASLARSCPGARLLVVDNGGMAPAAVEALHAACPGLEYRASLVNLGYGGANNLAIAEALRDGAQIVGLVNPDTWFEPGWAEPLLEAFARHPGHGILGPLQLTYDEGCAPADWTRKVLGCDEVGRLDAPLVDVPWIEGSALFARREVFERVGVFDPLYTMYYEEMDLCRRARRAGWRIGVVPASRFHHAGGVTLGGAESPERAVRKDLGQLLYLLTDPDGLPARNRAEAMRMLARRGRLWLRGRYPLFGRLLRESAALAWNKRGETAAKWRRDRAIARAA